MTIHTFIINCGSCEWRCDRIWKWGINSGSKSWAGLPIGHLVITTVMTVEWHVDIINIILKYQAIFGRLVLYKQIIVGKPYDFYVYLLCLHLCFPLLFILPPTDTLAYLIWQQPVINYYDLIMKSIIYSQVKRVYRDHILWSCFLLCSKIYLLWTKSIWSNW